MLNKFIIFLYIFILYCPLAAKENQDLIAVTPLEIKDEKWFVENFRNSFYKVYKYLIFQIGTSESPQTLGKKDTKIKEKLLIDTAKEEFKDYVSLPCKNYHAWKILLGKEKVGAILFRLYPNTKIIYLAQLFITPKWQKKGIAKEVVTKKLPSTFPEYSRYEVLTRYQNYAANNFYKKLGYCTSKEDFASKYGYLSSRYKSLYKKFPSGQGQ